MIQRDAYLMKAAYLFVKAGAERDLSLKAEFETMARAYLRLADQAERNAQNDIVRDAATAQSPMSRNAWRQVQERAACRVIFMDD